jgi:hypothetical protein
MTEFSKNFDENLMALSSNTKNIEEAIKEWQKIIELQYSKEKKQTCICNHKIQDVCIFLNRYNGNIIFCGTVCSTKLNQEEIDNKTLVKFFKLKNLHNEYRQFATIQEYLDYVKDELNAFIAKEIESSNNLNNLVILLEDIDKINKSYVLDIFNTYIDTIKVRIAEVIPSYIELEITNDISSIFEIMKKIQKLSVNYQVPMADINIFKGCIQRVVDHNITNYSGHTTPPFQQKVDNIIKKIEFIKEKTGKSLILKNFFIEMNEKLKNKIQSVRDHNFALDKAKYEAQQRYRARKAE